MVVVHLTSSPFFGGPERQMLGLARSLPAPFKTVFLLFSERGKHGAFLERIRGHGIEAVVLERNTPDFLGMVREISGVLRRLGAGVLCCHGYKADLVGLPAARRAKVPVVSVSRGWTSNTLKVRLYESVDRACLRKMDRVVCVSGGQAAKVRRAGVPSDRVVVIHNAIHADQFEAPDAGYRDQLHALFPNPVRRVVGAAGRLSPEKGFDILIDAAAVVTRSAPDVGFVLFGDGPLRGTLEQKIADTGLNGRFVLAGFRTDVAKFLPHLDLSALSSYTEGLPNVVLESYAAGTPVVATDVGGLPEVVEHGVDGYLVPPGNPAALADRILEVLNMGPEGRAMGHRGRERIRSRFTYEGQAVRYQQLFEELTSRAGRQPVGGVTR